MTARGAPAARAGRRPRPPYRAGQDPFAQAARLAEAIPLRPGSRVLDLGCGRAASSIWFARERGALVWAVDRDFPPAAVFAAARAARCDDRVFPLRADARDLPFRERSFDAAVAIDSWHYFGTDERFLSGLLRYLRPGGHVGVADVAFTREIGAAEAPPFLRDTFAGHWSLVHSVEWWRRRWERTRLVDVVAAGPLPESRRLLRRYALGRVAAGRADEIARAALEDDEGLIVLFRLVARKRRDARRPRGPGL